MYRHMQSHTQTYTYIYRHIHIYLYTHIIQPLTYTCTYTHTLCSRLSKELQLQYYSNSDIRQNISNKRNKTNNKQRKEPRQYFSCFIFMLYKRRRWHGDAPSVPFRPLPRRQLNFGAFLRQIIFFQEYLKIKVF